MTLNITKQVSRKRIKGVCVSLFMCSMQRDNGDGGAVDNSLACVIEHEALSSANLNKDASVNW